MRDIITVVLGGAWVVFGVLLFIGKLKLTIVYREEENHPSWKDEDEPVDNYVKPSEHPKPPTRVEAPKRGRGRPRKTTVPQQFPVPPVS